MQLIAELRLSASVQRAFEGILLRGVSQIHVAITNGILLVRVSLLA